METVGNRTESTEILLDAERVKQLRSIFHELANLFTGVLIAGGLLQRSLQGTTGGSYAEGICELGERGSALIREARKTLLGQDEVVPLAADAAVADSHTLGESEETGNGRD